MEAKFRVTLPATIVEEEVKPGPAPPPLRGGEMDALLLGRTRELVAAGPDDRNWRGIGIALLVIVCVCALIVTAVVLLTPGDKGSRVRKNRLNLEDVVNGAYNYRRFNGTWISGQEYLFQDAFGSIYIYNALNNTRQLIMPNSTFKQHSISMYSLSPDRMYILLAHKYHKVFRHTYRAAFLLYNISSDYLYPLFPDPDLQLQYAGWGPTGNQLVYIMNDDIYYMSSVDSKPQQITSNGAKGTIFNGIPDWVYEEEVLSSSHALWWSNDGKKLCFATFNDTNVDQIMYSYYGSTSDIKNVYPDIIGLRYPKPGGTNPTVALWVADLTTASDPQLVHPPKEYEDLEYYFTTAQWMDNNSLSIIWMKRSQNTSIISICRETNGWACLKNHQEDTYGNGWVDLYKELLFTDDKKYYFVILPGPPEGSAGRFRHIAMIDVTNGKKEFLTSGKYDVIDIVAYNSERKTVYYITTLEGKPGERHLFEVTDATSTSPKQASCLTCDIGPECLYNDVAFSKPSVYYILECNGPNVPRTELRNAVSNEVVAVLDTNEDLKELIERKALPQVKKLHVPISGGYVANVKLLLPPGLREDEITKYPLLLEVYGGPGSQMVKESFQINWGSYLASKKNIIYAMIDGRGSGNQGDKILHELYRRLGTVEVYDQITVMSYLKDHLPYIDKTKIAVFGWSYGGYVSAMILTTDDDVFKCGISVAPVTSWLYYDTVYTERYMQSPAASDNLINYEKSSVIKKAANFQGKKYLLVHGTADDNVHWQQSAMLTKALTDEGILFQMQIYPDERHALASVKLHLYRTLDKFLDNCYADSESSTLEANNT